jgi:hypothetical protein
MANFATFNPLTGASNLTYSEGNLFVSAAGAGDYNYHSSYSSLGVTSGKYYAEFTWIFGESNDSQIGVASYIYPRSTANQNGLASGVAVANLNQNYFDVDAGDNEQDGLSTAAIGDVFGVALNADDNEVTIYKNGSAWTTTHSLPTVLGPIFFITTTRANETGSKFRVNFGQHPWRYDPPSGFVALSTENLAEPAISNLAAEKPEDYFNTVLYAGNGSTQSITGVGFQPGLLWIKERSSTSSHQIYDEVRGSGKLLYANATSGEVDGTELTSLNSDGFTLGTTNGINESGQTYVAWCWKAGTSVSGSTGGSGTSKSYTGSVSTISGFSIIGYSGNGTSGHTIPHHLDQAPELLIVKRRTSSDNWAVTTPDVNRLYLNGANAAASIDYNWADQNSTVVTLNGTDAFMNSNTDTYIMYAWHSVEGYSKIGSYVGNGSSDGPFVYTGFRPAWVMFRTIEDLANWWIYDTKRNTYNVMNSGLRADVSDAEQTYTFIDCLSNGFKLRNTGGDGNGSGETHIYMAFAESPFKYSSAR